MGLGDDLMITALAKKVKLKYPDRQIVIGDFKRKLVLHSIIYDNNPNITHQLKIDNTKPIHYIDYHTLNRPYVDHSKSTSDNWVWNFNFKPVPGEIYFTNEEKNNADEIIIKAKDLWGKKNKKDYKGILFLESSSSKINNKQFHLKHLNKDWSFKNWSKLNDILSDEYLVIQSIHNESIKLDNAYYCECDFRLSSAVINCVDLYVGPEGGFGHVAAALNKKAVIYFGGWIHPDITGYDFHKNVYVDLDGSPCGSMSYKCSHCIKCRETITPVFMYDLILKELHK